MADRHTEELRTFTHLAGILAEEFPADLARRGLLIEVAPSALDEPAGQVLVLTLARLAPRFCHRIEFRCPPHPCIPRLRPLLAADHFGADELASLATLIWPDGIFQAATEGARPDVTLAVGGGGGDVTVGIDADGAAVVRREFGTRIARGEACMGALVAAAIAAAQTAALLYPEIVKGRVADLIRVTDGPFGGPLDPAAARTLERPVLAGVGAVGCAVVYALIAVGAKGQLLLIDPDHVSDSNLMRYILFDTRHLDLPKVHAARALAEASGLDLRLDGVRDVFQEHLLANPSERERLRLVISAVDTYQARRDIAGDLPREIVNAGTTPRDFTISRHGFGDGFACLACQYPVRETDVDEDSVMARELGLDAPKVAALRRTKRGLTADQLAAIATARGLPSDHFAAYVGEPLDSFYHKEFCAKLAVQTARGEAVAPLAFGSAMAGFLLAHAVAHRDADSHRKYRLDFISGIDHPLRSSPRARSACPYCGRPALTDVYRDRWSPPRAEQAA